MYIPIWVPVEELPQHMNIYPEEVAQLVVNSVKEGWPREPTQIFENPK
jgi:hypothetical protein